jgi:glycosyltransferase involved in cell wall biosynthesis
MIKKKNLVLLCNYDIRPNRIGGMDRFFKLFNTRMIEEGYLVKWFFYKGELFDYYDEFDIEIPKNNERITDYFLNYIKVNNYSVDVLVSHFIDTVSSFYKKCKQQGVIKTIAVDHMPRPIDGYTFNKRIKKRVKGYLYTKYTDMIIGVSKYIIAMTKNDYGIRASKKVQIIYNGIDIERFDYKTNFDREDIIKFIVPTNLRPEKGIHDLLNSLMLIDDSIKEKIQIDIYGTGESENELKQITIDNKLSNTVSFKGSTTQLPKLFCKYDYTLQPTYMEVFSLTILESLASNVPVITTPVGGNLEVITDGENGFIFNAKDKLKLATIITDIVMSSKEIKEKNTRKLVEDNFTINQMVDNHINAIKCI